jgi:hypothetical protein
MISNKTKDLVGRVVIVAWISLGLACAMAMLVDIFQFITGMAISQKLSVIIGCIVPVFVIMWEESK